MDTMINWLDREQEIKLSLEMDNGHKNRFSHAKQLANTIAKQDLAFVKMRNAGVKNLHPRMLERLRNTL